MPNLKDELNLPNDDFHDGKDYFIAHTLLNGMINSVDIFQKFFEQKIEGILIIAVIFVANYDHLRSLRSKDAAMPIEFGEDFRRKGISQSAVARVINMPRETTRRRIATLIEQKFVIEYGAGLYMTKTGESLILSSDLIKSLALESTKTFKMLENLGAVTNPKEQ